MEPEIVLHSLHVEPGVGSSAQALGSAMPQTVEASGAENSIFLVDRILLSFQDAVYVRAGSPG
jgi:hypothetical protein